MGLFKPTYYGSSKIVKRKSCLDMAMETPCFVKKFGKEAAESIMKHKGSVGKMSNVKMRPRKFKKRSHFSHSVCRRVW